MTADNVIEDDALLGIASATNHTLGQWTPAAWAVSSDGGSVLLGQTDRSRGNLRRFALCFTDLRNPDSIEHSVEELLRQRVYGLALGYPLGCLALPISVPNSRIVSI